MEPIRVLQVVTIMNRGGLETMLMNYYRQMDRDKIQFDFMVHREEEGHYDEEIKRLGGKIHHMPAIKPGNYRKYFRELKDFFSNNLHYRVVHSHINENSSFVLDAARKAGIPGRIAHSHLSDLGLDLKLPFRIYARYCMRDNPSDYFACSQKAGQWLFGKRLSEKNLIVLNNAVNTNDFKFNKGSRNKIRSELGIKENQLVIGHIGRFNKQKNHEFLIDIFNSVSNRQKDAVLILVGEGYIKASIKQKVSKLGLEKNIKFLGLRSDIPDLMQAMDLFVFPSLFEGLPVVLIEAQAAGLHCIASNTITEESNLTGLIKYIGLDKSSEDWAEEILNSSYSHVDYSSRLKETGYDTVLNSQWLNNFYFKYYKTKEDIKMK